MMIAIRTMMVSVMLTMLMLAAGYAQETITATGTVKNSQGVPLAGVSVSVIGSKAETQTNAQGLFEIEVASLQDSLEFSSVAHITQTVHLQGGSSVEVVLEDGANDLDEVVVVGYGTQRKGSLTGSVDVITADQLQDRPANNVGDLIKGASPNMNIDMGMRGGEPGSTSTWNIRGVGSISGNSSPLILVDGVEMDVTAIDPETVESISILKDASAAAVYGSRAPFGVILISTKKGSTEDGVKIDYSNNLSVSNPLRLPSFIDSYTWATAYNQANANAGLTPIYSDEQMERIQ
ncbi:MAG: TonB-dependent receptor plug domain-containing protein, partial [Sphingobacterium sp.]